MEHNELSYFDFRLRSADSGFYAPVLLDGVEYQPFHHNGRHGLVWRSQGIWLMVEAEPHIIPGGFIIGDRRALFIAADGFAFDKETGRMVARGPLAAHYTDSADLPEAVILIVTTAAARYDDLLAEFSA